MAQPMPVSKYDPHTNDLKDKNHTVILTNAQKAFEKNYNLSGYTSWRNRVEETYFNIIKPICDKSTTNTVLNGKNPLKYILFN